MEIHVTFSSLRYWVVRSLSLVTAGGGAAVSVWPDNEGYVFLFLWPCTKDSKWLIVGALAVAAAVITTYAERLLKPSRDILLAKLVDNFQQALFAEVTGKVSEHRVTLFQRKIDWKAMREEIVKNKKLTLKLIRSLQATRRSGHLTQNGIERFMAPDRPDGTTHGVAGEAWVSQGAVACTDLIEINSRSSKTSVADYARRTFVSVEWVNKRRNLEPAVPLPRSLYGVRIEVDEVRWGCIVVDSTDPNILDKWQHLYPSFVKMLSEILRRTK